MIHTQLGINTYPIPEIVKTFSCLLPNKCNVSPDGLSKGLLTNLSIELCYPLSIIFTRILNDGICPLIWKKSNITAIHKKGDSTLSSHYRPISILSSTLILYEQILSYYLSNYLRSNGLMYSEQYGFLSGKSTQLQLIEFYRNIMRSMNNHIFADVAYIDMEKAFDKVSISKYYIRYIILVYVGMCIPGLNHISKIGYK